jgi:hypothetical protein
VISRGDESEDKLASQRVYTVREVASGLSAAGLRVLDFFESVREDPYDFGAQNLILVAEKPAGERPSRAIRG